jgi:hypothetical protein
MYRWLVSVLVLGLAACGLAPDSSSPFGDGLPNPPETEIELKNYGPAPELTNDVWLNVEQPLRLADLRGKVVLLDMWTFG